MLVDERCYVKIGWVFLESDKRYGVMRKRTHKIKEKFYLEYCMGCGLCGNAEGVRYIKHNGFLFPTELTEEQINFCEKACPVSSVNYNQRIDKKLWEPDYEIYKGWSLYDEIRYKASRFWRWHHSFIVLFG